MRFLTPAHKDWGYSRPLRRRGAGQHKACGCSEVFWGYPVTTVAMATLLRFWGFELCGCSTD